MNSWGGPKDRQMTKRQTDDQKQIGIRTDGEADRQTDEQSNK